MDKNKSCGGACGEIQVDLSDFGCGNYLLGAIQYYEYKVSHFIDKSFEAMFGFQSVLPGAFSVFRWRAIKDKPLEEFFKGINRGYTGLRFLNMYLAEDRIMCYYTVN